MSIIFSGSIYQICGVHAGLRFMSLPNSSCRAFQLSIAIHFGCAFGSSVSVWLGCCLTGTDAYCHAHRRSSGAIREQPLEPERASDVLHHPVLYWVCRVGARSGFPLLATVPLPRNRVISALSHSRAAHALGRRAAAADIRLLYSHRCNAGHHPGPFVVHGCNLACAGRQIWPAIGALDWLSSRESCCTAPQISGLKCGRSLMFAMSGRSGRDAAHSCLRQFRSFGFA